VLLTVRPKPGHEDNQEWEKEMREFIQKRKVTVAVTYKYLNVPFYDRPILSATRTFTLA
jgi:hypothetical protein